MSQLQSSNSNNNFLPPVSSSNFTESSRVIGDDLSTEYININSNQITKSAGIINPFRLHKMKTSIDNSV